MRDPERLLIEGASEAERVLLAAAASEEPPADGMARLAAALGATLPVAPAPSSAVRGGSVKLAGKGLYLWSGAGVVLLSAALYVGRPQSPAAEPRVTASTPVLPAPPKAAEPRVSAAERATTPSISSDLAAELALLDRVRALRRAKDERGALLLLTRYEREYPTGVLAEEAELLRFEGLLARRDRAAAVEFARGFLERHPHSVHRERLRTYLGRETHAR